MTKQHALFQDIPLPQTRPQRNGRHSSHYCHAERLLNVLNERFSELLHRMEAIEALLHESSEMQTRQQTVKESYTTLEVAKILGKRPYTVREWCRNQRVNAYKPGCVRGAEEEWRITHDELLRIRNEGLLPRPERY